MEHLLSVLADAAAYFDNLEGAPAVDAAIAALADPCAPAALAAEAVEATALHCNADSPRESRSRSRERASSDPYGGELEEAVLEQAKVADIGWWSPRHDFDDVPDDEPGHAFEEPASASSGHAWETSASSGHPWEVASATRGRSTGLTLDERHMLKHEEWSARRDGIPWEERGPTAGEAAYWRGQGWRRGLEGGKQRYSNRGGKNKEYYAQAAWRGTLVVKHTDPWKGISIVPGQGKPSEKGKGEKGKGNGKSDKGKSEKG